MRYNGDGLVLRIINSKTKKLVPSQWRQWIQTKLRSHNLRKSIEGFKRLPVGELPSREALAQLAGIWGNEGFAARLDYLDEVSKRANETKGPILECGSGLTSILLGLFAGRRGVEVWSLEHSREWQINLSDTLKRNRIEHVTVCAAQLRDYGDFSWYDAPLDHLPKLFSLIICDGPPGDCKGGRYGLLPVFRQRLAPDALILLDDADRPGERDVLARWVNEASCTVEIRNDADGSFAVVSCP
ncbi:MAG: hypothetical protein ACRD9S_06065 [Pyrinomonadaceae bacterium]